MCKFNLLIKSGDAIALEYQRTKYHSRYFYWNAGAP